jgi:transposase
MGKKYIVDLTDEERRLLNKLVKHGKDSARRIRWAHALLKAADGWTDEKIGEAFDISLPTVHRLRQRFVEEGMEIALGAHSRMPRPEMRKIDGEKEARLIAIACSEPPEGRARWSLRMLADKMVQLSYVESVSHETVRQVLKKTK